MLPLLQLMARFWKLECVLAVKGKEDKKTPEHPVHNTREYASPEVLLTIGKVELG